MDDNKTISISHFSMAGNFFHLVSNILEETVSHGNIHTVWTVPSADIDSIYNEKTKWSDFRVMIPTLFLFFHAIELLLKAANYKITAPINKPSHDLARLFSDFKNNYPSSSEITNLLDKYIYPTKQNCPLLFEFIQSNSFNNSSKFYELLKYPYSRNFDKHHQHGDIRFLNSKGIPMFRDIITDIKSIRTEMANL